MGEIVWNLEGPIELAAAALLGLTAIASLLLAWRRLGKHNRLRWTGVACLNVIAALAILALFAPPSWIKPATDSIVLLTEGAGEDDASGTSVYVAPGSGDFGRGPDYLLDTGQLPIREPTLGVLEIMGHGLDEEQWARLPADLAVRFSPPDLSGFVTDGWQRELSEGEPLVIAGRVLSGAEEAPTTIELVDPAGIAVARHDVLASGMEFELITLPKGPGLLDYELRALRDSDEIAAEPVPVHVRASRSPSLYILQSAPSFETRQLQNWAGDNGAAVVVDSIITRGRELRQRINADSLPNDALSPELLRSMDLAVVDGRAWAGLSSQRKAWFIEAVREGLGLLIFADDDLVEYLTARDSVLEGFQLSRRDRDPDGYFPVWKGVTSEQALPLATLALDSGDGIGLTRITSGEVVEAFLHVGLGRLAVSVLRERHRWLTSGNEATYTAYWSRLISTIGRPAPLPYMMPAADDLWARPGQRSRVCGMTATDPMALEVAQLHSGELLSLETAAPATGGPLRCAEFWPWAPGWYRAQTVAEGTGDATAESYFYVFGNAEWQTQHRYQRQQASSRRALAPEVAREAASRTARTDLEPFWPWLLFVTSAGLLWLERRLF